MRVLLSTIGSRGDVQPIVALALALKGLGHEVRTCVPPDFREWIESLGVPVIPIGPELRGTGRSNPSGARLTPEQGRRMMEESVATQFETIASAAQGCDAIVGATALQIAAPSIAERMGIPYVFAAYCPAVLPSVHHAPPVLSALGDKPKAATADHATLWAADAQRWNTMWSGMLNSHRTALGLARIDDMRGYIHTKRPWLAADPTLAPWPDPCDEAVFQTGAWILTDERRLPDELESFLVSGTAPL
jgi:vancomycin aglycone glucosyltransferase